jgi:hypothetical protein
MNVDEDIGGEQCVLRSDARRSLHDIQLGELTERYHRAVHHGDEYVSGDRFGSVAQLPGIANGYIKALASLDGGCDHLAAECGADDVMDFTDGQAVSAERVGVRDDVEVIATGQAFGVGAGRTRDLADDSLDLLCDPAHLDQIVAEDLDADRRPNPR